MGRIVFQCYPPVSEVPMTSGLARRPFPLIPLALLAACNTETSNERVLGIQAMSFVGSEWSEPVHLDAPVIHPRAPGEPARGHRRARGWILREIRGIDGIHRREVLDVRQEHRALHRAVERAGACPARSRPDPRETASPRDGRLHTFL